jgi:hypothetical protein
VHPDKNAGKPVAAPAPRTDCTNLRRVRRKTGLHSFRRYGITFYRR